ncbi:26S proteasome subunit beta type 1-like protein, partial [Thalassiosira pseudonana CCMP1335]
KFDPYQLNGGLVAAVAGKDYVIIASDTRLTDGGYGINSRRNIQLQQTNLPVMIGSAGCASDCESLKRRVRLELDSLECNFPSGKMGVQSVANLLQQVLYGRRGFPFYSFCVVAGIDRDEQTGDSKCGMGAVYVYDAIGSFERVAVGSAGTGRELLQPILDRMGSIKQNNNVIQDGLAQCTWEEAVNNVARAYQSVAEREISVGDEVVICVVKASGSTED